MQYQEKWTYCYNCKCIQWTVYKMQEKQTCYLSSNGKYCIHDWHSRLAHRDVNVLSVMASNNDLDVKDCNCSDICDICLRGKMSRKPFPQKANIKSKEVLDLIVSNVCGKLPTESIGGSNYFVTFIDDFSRYSIVYCIREKSRRCLIS